MRRLLACLLLLLVGCERAPQAPTLARLQLPAVPPGLQGCFRLELGRPDRGSPLARWLYLDLDQRPTERLLARVWRPGLELASEAPAELDHAGRLELWVARPEQVVQRDPDTVRGQLEGVEVPVPAERWRLSGRVVERDGDVALEGEARVEELATGRSWAFELHGTRIPEDEQQELFQRDLAALAAPPPPPPLPPAKQGYEWAHGE